MSPIQGREEGEPAVDVDKCELSLAVYTGHPLSAETGEITEINDKQQKQKSATSSFDPLHKRESRTASFLRIQQNPRGKASSLMGVTWEESNTNSARSAVILIRAGHDINHS